jgi:hypothetical protein
MPLRIMASFGCAAEAQGMSAWGRVRVPDACRAKTSRLAQFSSRLRELRLRE